MKITHIVAASTNNAIGRNNELLWHLPNDLKFLKNNTWGMPVVMGRKTFVSCGSRPLPGRLNIIITRQKDFTAEGIAVVHSFDDAVFLAKQHNFKELMVLGGSEIYNATINKAQKILLTRVHAVFENADAFFPEITEKQWKLVSNRDCFQDEKHAYDYSFQVWERK